MSKKILVILGHPDSESLCGALAESYAAGAREAGAEVREMRLGELQFDPILHKGYREIQELEPDLAEAQRAILWAEHIVWVYPTWWGTMPALMKGFLDRVFLPSFAFKYHPNSPWWDRLLKGRSGRMIVTMDAPTLYDTFAYWAGGRRTLKKATLEFCGIKPVRITTFGQVKFADEPKREKWLAKVRDLGARLS